MTPTNELKTMCKQLRRLSMWDLIRTNHAAHVANDKILMQATKGELRRRGR